ncbi:MAG: tail fiber domain-containing protein [Bacteroidales bacterium]
MKSKNKTLLYLVWLCLLSLPLGAFAQNDIPSAMKYQAVLHDLEGNTLANKSDINIRISIRKEQADGPIVYSEDHKGISTSPFGLVNLEIGRGISTTNTTLQNIPWGQGPLYVQIEVEFDHLGYTQMGNSELLTVPYAFYAANAGAKEWLGNLSDNVLPKYNASDGIFVNSGISQEGSNLYLNASKITFKNGTQVAYSFPTIVGDKGQTLTLVDEFGNLGWRKIEGGGSGSSANFDSLGTDGNLVFWNDVKGFLKSAPIYYDYSNAENLDFLAGTKFRMQGNLETSGEVVINANGNPIQINGIVSGINNLMTNSLDQQKIWMGNRDNKAVPVRLFGDLSIDTNGKVTVVRPSYTLNIKQDSVLMDSNGIVSHNRKFSLLDYLGVWKASADKKYIYNNGNFSQTYIGIGTSTPLAKLHVDSASFLVTSKLNDKEPLSINGTGVRLFWAGTKGALRAGGVSGDAWNTSNVGLYSVGLGYDAKAVADYNVAIGFAVEANKKNGVAIGQNLTVDAPQSFAIGYNSQITSVAGTDAFSIGFGNRVSESYTMSVGSNIDNSASYGLAFGNNLTVSGKKAIAIGIGDDPATRQDLNAGGENSVAIGHNVITKGKSSIVIGDESKNEPPVGSVIAVNKSIVIGSHAISEGETSITLGVNTKNAGSSSFLLGIGDGGTTISTNTEAAFGSVNIGFGNQNLEGQTISIGSLITNNTPNTIVLGTANIPAGYNTVNPLLVLAQQANVFEFSTTGDIYTAGNIINPSDIRLKKDINPLSFNLAYLDSILPVSYRYKSDKQNKLRFGFIAQEIKKYYPSLVEENAKGYLSLNYTNFIPILWQYTQGLYLQYQKAQKVIKDQENKLQQQQEQIRKLEADMAIIKAKIGL